MKKSQINSLNKIISSSELQKEKNLIYLFHVFVQFLSPKRGCFPSQKSKIITNLHILHAVRQAMKGQTVSHPRLEPVMCRVEQHVRSAHGRVVPPGIQTRELR